MEIDKGNCWGLGNGPIVFDDLANAPIDDSIKLMVHSEADECASRSSMHIRDDQKA